ncbi:MAG: lysine-epsilon-oxidase maturase LodB [Bacteroidota bacterium]
MTLFKTDVLIVGGGPAGASAALSLLNYSPLSVLLVEQSDLNQLRVGEHVSPSIFDLLAHLKLSRTDFEPNCFRPSYGMTSYWGSSQANRRESIFTGEQSTFQLDRKQFDWTLLERVAKLGGQVFPRTKCIRFQQLEEGWKIGLRHPVHGSFEIETSYLMDATGRQCAVGRQIGIPSQRLDKLMGVGAFLQFEEERPIAQNQVLEAVETGWWYYASLPQERMAVVFFSDADLISKYQLHKKDNWVRHLSATRQVRQRVEGAVAMAGQPWVRNAFSQISNAQTAHRFLAVGDAACSFDPISSMGIGFAMNSACHAARIVQAELEDPQPARLHHYQKDLQRHFDQYLQMRQRVYAQERRWPEAPFWQCRSTEPAKQVVSAKDTNLSASY